MANNVYLGLGSNIGDRIKNIQNASKAIKNDSKCEIIDVSSIYETIPYGFNDQTNFMNAVVKISTKYSARELFNTVKKLEKKLGRKNYGSKRWGPRKIDIDILLYDDLILETDDLVIPHIELENRDFVLTPLLEISNNIVNPKTQKKLNNIDFASLDKTIIRIITDEKLE